MNLNAKYNITLFYLKFLKNVFITQDLNGLLKITEELGVDYKSLYLLIMLQDLITKCTTNHSLPESVNQNLYNYINICRFSNQGEERDLCFELCNRMIISLNSSKGKPPYPLYQTLINSCFTTFKERFKYHNILATNPSAVIKMLSATAELEYLILFFHSPVVDREEFEEYISEDLLLSVAYLLASDQLLRDEPFLLKDKLFLSRLSYVLKNNELLLQEYKGEADEKCLFELAPGDDEILKNKNFWKLHNKVKKKVIDAEKDS